MLGEVIAWDSSLSPLDELPNLHISLAWQCLWWIGWRCDQGGRIPSPAPNTLRFLENPCTCWNGCKGCRCQLCNGYQIVFVTIFLNASWMHPDETLNEILLMGSSSPEVRDIFYRRCRQEMIFPRNYYENTPAEDGLYETPTGKEEVPILEVHFPNTS